MKENIINSAAAVRLPNNEAKVAEFKKRNEAYDARNQAVAKLFDPVALLQRAGQIHESQHPTLKAIPQGEASTNIQIIIWEFSALIKHVFSTKSQQLVCNFSIRAKTSL